MRQEATRRDRERGVETMIESSVAPRINQTKRILTVSCPRKVGFTLPPASSHRIAPSLSGEIANSSMRIRLKWVALAIALAAAVTPPGVAAEADPVDSPWYAQGRSSPRKRASAATSCRCLLARRWSSPLSTAARSKSPTHASRWTTIRGGRSEFRQPRIHQRGLQRQPQVRRLAVAVLECLCAGRLRAQHFAYARARDCAPRLRRNRDRHRN